MYLFNCMAFSSLVACHITSASIQGHADCIHYLFILAEFGQQIDQGVQGADIFGLELVILPQEILWGFGEFCYFNLKTITTIIVIVAPGKEPHFAMQSMSTVPQPAQTKCIACEDCE